jgi:hypothetical protein
MPLAFGMIRSPVVASVALLRHRVTQQSAFAAVAVAVLATWLAPDASPSSLDWARILLLVSVGALGLLMLIAARDPSVPLAERQQRLIGAGVLVLMATLLNATFTVGTAIMFSTGFSLIAMLAVQDDRQGSSWQFQGLLSVIIPIWVWTALGAWDWGLLMLVPLAALAFISDRHIRDAATARRSDPATNAVTLLSRRGHRLGSWLGILSSALLTLTVGLVSDAANTWVALGAFGAIGAIGLEAGLRGLGMAAARRSIRVCDAGLVWIALCWMVSL